MEEMTWTEYVEMERIFQWDDAGIPLIGGACWDKDTRISQTVEISVGKNKMLEMAERCSMAPNYTLPMPIDFEIPQDPKPAARVAQ